MTAALPERLALHRYGTPMGDLALATDDADVLRGVELWGDEARLSGWMRAKYGKNVVLSSGRTPAAVRGLLDEYFAGRLDALDEIACQADGTPFQKSVWAALRRIPAGQTISYGQLAQRLDKPSAVRAVGLANGSNPISIVIPCHRVIGSDGSLTGYGGGLERKRWLLTHEGRFSPLLR